MAEEDLNIEPREPLELRMCMVSVANHSSFGNGGMNRMRGLCILYYMYIYLTFGNRLELQRVVQQQ